MRLHPRTRPVSLASCDFEDSLWKFMRDRDLTYVETLRILIECQQTITKYMLRAERHPDDPDAKADEA